MTKKYLSQCVYSLSQSGGGDSSPLARKVNTSNYAGVDFPPKSAENSLLFDRLNDVFDLYAEYGRTATIFYREVP